MRKLYVLILFLFFMSMAAGSKVKARRLIGTLVDGNNMGVSDATVELTPMDPDGDTPKYVAHTSGNGNFYIVPIDSGKYEVGVFRGEEKCLADPTIEVLENDETSVFLPVACPQ